MIDYFFENLCLMLVCFFLCVCEYEVFIFHFLSGIDKSHENLRFQPILASCAFITRVIADRLFLRKFVFDVCMFRFIFVPRQILWILKNFYFCTEYIGDGVTLVSSRGVIRCGLRGSKH